MTKLKSTIAEYYAARKEAEEARRIAAEKEGISRALEQKVVDMMLENGTNSLSMDDGTRPTLVKRVNISVTQDNNEEVRKWLLEFVGDDTPYIVTQADKWRVHKLVKEKMEREGFDQSDFPSFLNVSTRPGIRVGGWQGREEE